MEFKLKSGRKLKIKDVSLDDRDTMLDGVSYKFDKDGNTTGMEAMHSTITKWIRMGIDGDTSDEVLKTFTMEERTETFLKIQGAIVMGEEKASS